MAPQPHTRAEDVVRALATAAAAARLYPPTSDIPRESRERFVAISDVATHETGPLRVLVDPKSFRYGDLAFGEGNPQLQGLAETLYAHQVGQLIVAPGLTVDESLAFLECIGSDAGAVREEGGLRHVMVTAGIEHIAVIELTLRASTEEGLLGLDLTSAPLDVIGHEVVRAAGDWAREGVSGRARDLVDEAVGRLEPAAQEMAQQRIAQALLQLDEQTRAAVLAAAARPDTTGTPMEGALRVIATMRPAALARLLTMAASRTGADPSSVMSKLELPPETMRALELMLRPSPRSESECGVPPQVDAGAIAEEATRDDGDDAPRVAQAIAAATPAASAIRGLKTTLAVLPEEPDADGIDAVGEALGPALAAGGFRTVGRALEVLDEAAQRPQLEMHVARARQALAHGDLLAEGLGHLSDPAFIPDAASVVAHAGVTGAEVLLRMWQESAPEDRALLEAVALRMPEQVVSVGGRRLRSDGAIVARDLVGLLGRLGDRRAIPVIATALQHPAQEVRAAALSTLAQNGSEEAWNVVIGAMRHADEATAIRAIGEVRSARVHRAGPALVSLLDLRRPVDRTWDFHREVIECTRVLRVPEAVPVLKREAGQWFVLGHSARQSKQAAREAVAEILADRVDRAPSREV